MSDDIRKEIIEATVNQAKMQQQANTELGITQDYNKENRAKLWDSTAGKRNYKDKVFGDKETITDPISGKTLHKSQTAAQNKYHMKNAEGVNVSSKWAEHSAETDHINSLKSIHDSARHNPFLSDSDFKEIANSDVNYRVLSKKDNTSKGEKSDFQVIADKNSGIPTDGKIQMAKEKVGSDIALHGKFAAKTAENIGNEFASGAKDTLVASAIPLAAEGINKMIKVAQGEQSLGEAAKDMSKLTVDIAVAGGKNKLILDTVTSQLAKSNNPFLKSVAGSNQVAQIITVASIVQESAVRYINGEIDGQEFIEEIGKKGTTMVAGMIGGQVGREIGGIIGGIIGTTFIPGAGTGAGYLAGQVIGDIIGTVITTVACSGIISVYNTYKHLDDYKLKESQIKKLETEALNEMANQRIKFRTIVEREYKKWDDEIQQGFDMMFSSLCEETCNIQGITDGLDHILSVFGKEVKFKNIEEYEAQLDMPLKLKF